MAYANNENVDVGESLIYWTTELSKASSPERKVKCAEYLQYYTDRTAWNAELAQRYAPKPRIRIPVPRLTLFEIACAPLYFVYLIQLAFLFVIGWGVFLLVVGGILLSALGVH